MDDFKKYVADATFDELNKEYDQLEWISLCTHTPEAVADEAKLRCDMIVEEMARRISDLLPHT